MKRSRARPFAYACGSLVFLSVLLLASRGNRTLVFGAPYDLGEGSSFECSDDDICTLKNVCLDRENVFQFFLKPGEVDANIRSRLEEINLVAAWQLPAKEYRTLLSVRTHPLKSIGNLKLERARFFTDPVFIHIMLAVGNFGHTLLQNTLPAVLSMAHSSLKLNRTFQTITLNDCKSCGFPDPSKNICMDGIGSFGYDLCDSMRLAMYRSVTGYSAVFARELFTESVAHLCFKNAVVGFPAKNRFDLLYNPTGEEFSNEKKLIRTRIGIPNSLSITLETRKSWRTDSIIYVAVYCKDTSRNGRHGNTFQDCDGFIELIRTVEHSKKLDVTKLNFDGMEFDKQIQTLQKFDIYISDGGSSSYYTHFLRAGAISMTFPLCDESCSCVHLFADAYHNPVVSHIAVNPLHVACRTSEHTNSIFKPLFDVRKSFNKQFDEALNQLH